MGTPSEDGSLWVFASEFYDQPEVRDRCLALQNQHGVNVNILLWLCWLDHSHNRLRKRELKQALTIVGGHNDRLLLGLRALRGSLLSDAPFTRVQQQKIRKHILAAELSIEKILLQRLQDLTARLSKVDEQEACLSLFDYFDQMRLSEADDMAAFFLERSRNLETAE